MNCNNILSWCKVNVPPYLYTLQEHRYTATYWKLKLSQQERHTWLLTPLYFRLIPQTAPYRLWTSNKCRVVSVTMLAKSLHQEVVEYPM